MSESVVLQQCSATGFLRGLAPAQVGASKERIRDCAAAAKLIRPKNSAVIYLCESTRSRCFH